MLHPTPHNESAQVIGAQEVLPAATTLAGPTAGTTIVAGHSHMFAMGAMQRYQGPLALVPIPEPYQEAHFLMEEWKGDRSSAYWEFLVNSGAHHSVIITFNGNQHHADFLLAPEPLVDFIDDVDDALHPGAVAVPRALVKAHFAPTLTLLRDVLSRLRDSGCRATAVLGTPPPQVDLAQFSDLIRHSRFFSRVAERNGLDISSVALTPSRILLKMWRVVQELLHEAADAGNAVFVPVPDITRDSDGFLAPTFRAHTGKEGDITHANAAFGRLMLERGMASLTESRRG